MIMSYLSKYLISGVLALLPMKNSALDMTLENYLENKTEYKTKHTICYFDNDSISNNSTVSDIYDYTAHQFVTKKGGLSEEFLNKSLIDLFVFEESKEFLDYLKYVDSTENNYYWSKLDSSRVIKSSLTDTYTTAINNFDMIFLTDMSNMCNLSTKYHSLKKVLLSLDSIASESYNYSEQLVLSYELLQKNILNREDNQSSIPMNELFNGKTADCNDIVPAFYTILRYYGYDVCMRFGTILNLDGKFLGNHVWLSVNIDNIIIDLDPTWYGSFAPLENRSNSIPYDFLEKRCTIKLNK